VVPPKTIWGKLQVNNGPFWGKLQVKNCHFWEKLQVKIGCFWEKLQNNAHNDCNKKNKMIDSIGLFYLIHP